MKNDIKKRHQYLIRLDTSHFSKLRKMAEDQPMSNVVNRGIDTEWILFSEMKKIKVNPLNFKSVNDIQDWKVNSFKDSPELLTKYVLPSTILNYIVETSKTRQVNQNLVDNLETVQYAIRIIGTNINQLAKKANSGRNVSKEELKKLTRAVISLKSTIDKYVSNKGGDKG